MYTNQVIKLEERFYLDERGFKFVVRTGLDMSVLLDGEIKSILKRPNGTIVKRTIPLTDIQSATTGTVLMSILEGDLNQKGEYQAQIFIKDASLNRARPSHIFTFVVGDPVVPDFETIFP